MSVPSLGIETLTAFLTTKVRALQSELSKSKVMEESIESLTKLS